jgi:hypothetical protein
MMATRVNHFELDWWIIQKRAIYFAVLAVLVCLIAGGAALYVWKYGNPLRNVALHSDPMAGARFMSFEGDVRVIRASTTIVSFIRVTRCRPRRTAARGSAWLMARPS